MPSNQLNNIEIAPAYQYQYRKLNSKRFPAEGPQGGQSTVHIKFHNFSRQMCMVCVELPIQIRQVLLTDMFIHASYAQQNSYILVQITTHDISCITTKIKLIMNISH